MGTKHSETPSRTFFRKKFLDLANDHQNKGQKIYQLRKLSISLSTAPINKIGLISI